VSADKVWFPEAVAAIKGSVAAYRARHPARRERAYSHASYWITERDLWRSCANAAKPNTRTRHILALEALRAAHKVAAWTAIAEGRPDVAVKQRSEARRIGARIRKLEGAKV
jgi:hypothetical protein